MLHAACVALVLYMIFADHRSALDLWQFGSIMVFGIVGILIAMMGDRRRVRRLDKP